MPAQECDRGKKTLVLDLDQTLVVASYTSQGDHDFTVDNSPFGVFYMHKRPGLDTFLRTVAQRFEIVVYTAATSDYAGEIPRLLLLPEKYYLLLIITNLACTCSFYIWGKQGTHYSCFP